jgi:hypothetical protein
MTDALSHIIDKAQARHVVDQTLAHMLTIAVKQGNKAVEAELRWTIAARVTRLTVESARPSATTAPAA